MNRRRVLTAALMAAAAAGAVAFFIVIPHALDRHRNALGPEVESGVSLPVPALHARLRIADLHADTLLWDRDLLVWNNRGHVDLPRLQKGNVSVQVFSIVTKAPRGLNVDRNAGDSDNITPLAIAQRWPPSTWSSLSERVLYQARRLHQAAAASDGQLRVLRSGPELDKFLADRARDPELVGAILAVEGAHALEGDLTKLHELAGAGVRIVAPTHLFDSELAGAQAGVGHGGLTALGRAWVQEMDRRHLIIDLAHASEATIEDVLALSSRPPIVSHTGFKATCDTNRNLSSALLKKVAAKGGLVGVGFWDEATCGRDVESIVRSLRAAVDAVGPDHVALGTDWDGFVPVPIDASRLGWLTGRLLEAGFSETDVRKFMGENALDFLRAQLPQDPN